MSGRGIAALLLLGLSPGCEESKPRPSPDPATKGGVELVAAPGDGDVAPWVKAQVEKGQAEGKQVLVYVGATWCEPCMRFHQAAEAGELDEAFPRLRLLEYDLDRDGKRLAEAGCASPYIPLFAKPTAEGRCQKDDWVMGGVKGEQAVDQLRPRLERLLAQTPR